jgi:serine/threonine protein kinase
MYVYTYLMLFLAPEIATKIGTYDKSSDVYSFGVILLELFFPGYFKLIHNHSMKYTFRITNEHEISLKLSSNSEKKRQCLETIAKLISECGKAKR